MAADLQDIFKHHKRDKSSLIPALQEVQENEGYVSEAAVHGLAKYLGIMPNEVFGVITFYAMFRTTPIGRNLVRVCRGTACHVRGGVMILKEVEKRTNLRAGETSKDLEYTLETVACIGACSLAPTMVINGETHGLMTAQKVAELLPHI